MRTKVTHAPTIGDMYEGLSADLLGRAIPDGLGLSIVTGFATDGKGRYSGQLDCMLVRGEGERIPYTNSYVWNVKDIIAVIEVKKSLRRGELRDALGQLRSVFEIEQEVLDDPEIQNRDVRPALLAFAQTTGKVAPLKDDPEVLEREEQAVLDTLLREQVSAIRIVLGMHGFKSEASFRTALVDLLEEGLSGNGFGPASLPQLIISGDYSLVKANGRPYSVGMVDGKWPFYCSTPVNPLLVLLEVVWSRLEQMFRISQSLWGEDLNGLEALRPLLLARGCAGGWEITSLELTGPVLDEAPVVSDWAPLVVTFAEFVIFHRLCADGFISMRDEGLRRWLAEQDLDPDELRRRLISTRLVAAKGDDLLLIAEDCATAILPTGEFVVAENNSGRLTRWISKNGFKTAQGDPAS